MPLKPTAGRSGATPIVKNSTLMRSGAWFLPENEGVATADAGVDTTIHVENELMRVHCHSGDLAGALHILQVTPELWSTLEANDALSRSQCHSAAPAGGAAGAC